MPIFVRVSAFDGDIERLLDRAVASFDNASYATLARSVRQLRVTFAIHRCDERVLAGAPRPLARGCDEVRARPFASVCDEHRTPARAFEHRVEFKPLTPDDRQRVFCRARATRHHRSLPVRSAIRDSDRRRSGVRCAACAVHLRTARPVHRRTTQDRGTSRAGSSAVPARLMRDGSNISRVDHTSNASSASRGSCVPRSNRRS
jgi:hypothetical protein